ncbi:sensor histidine kinase [Winogradskya consettensis]|uniref:histidine kinase n=1 Tax=Winogradskya consettensis TaxID=113560 RepID=A0A919ST48_9ACTN|nr:two-component sensor histidine kinase [Actinoplanes consettensis]
MGRLFDARGALVRWVLVDLAGVGFLVYSAQAHRSPGADQWVLAVIAFTAALVLRNRPTANLAAQAVLLAVAMGLLDDPTINQVGAGWALLEVTIWARPVVRWWGAGLLSVVYVAGGYGSLFVRVFGLMVAVVVPLLLGMVVRISAELAREASERVAEGHRRRESELRAARADERTAIARELHDVVAHHVASMVLRVGVARHVLPGLDPQVSDVFDDVHGTGTTALADLRRLVAVLRDPDGVRGDAALTAIEPAALPAALDGAVETARRSGLVVDAEISPAAGALDAVRGLAVLRLTQEALTNVAKHAGPGSHVRLVLAVDDGDVTWEVRDDGGRDTWEVRDDGGRDTRAVPAVPSGGGHGLTGMRERVSVLGGELEAGPLGTGWRVRTLLPKVTA